MKIIVGLGNPGRKYDGTRHNVGFDVIDRLASSPGVSSFSGRFQAQIAEAREDAEKVLLVKPETFMNLSGLSVRQLVDFYQTPITDVLIVCDDVNLPLGKLRFRAKGTHGGHNGLRDIQGHLGTTDYARLRIGVDAPGGDGMVDHVLGKFRPAEKAAIEDGVSLAVQACAKWIREGIQSCMNQYNS